MLKLLVRHEEAICIVLRCLVAVELGVLVGVMVLVLSGRIERATP